MYFLESEEGFLTEPGGITDDLDWALEFKDLIEARTKRQSMPHPTDWAIYEDISE